MFTNYNVLLGTTNACGRTNSEEYRRIFGEEMSTCRQCDNNKKACLAQQTRRKQDQGAFIRKAPWQDRRLRRHMWFVWHNKHCVTLGKSAVVCYSRANDLCTHQVSLVWIEYLGKSEKCLGECFVFFLMSWQAHLAIFFF